MRRSPLSPSDRRLLSALPFAAVWFALCIAGAFSLRFGVWPWEVM